MAKATLKTNSSARKEAAHKAGKCQLCGEKTKGHSVYIDYDKNKVVKTRAGAAKEGRAFYCKTHADKKVKRLEWRLARRNGDQPKAKAKATKKAAPSKKATKAKAKPAKKAPAKTKAKKAAKAPAKAAPKKAKKADKAPKANGKDTQSEAAPF